MKNQLVKRYSSNISPLSPTKKSKYRESQDSPTSPIAVHVNGTPTYIFKRNSPGCDHFFQHKIADIRYREGIGSKCYVFNSDYSIEDFISNTRHPLRNQMATPSMFQAIMLKLHKLHHLKISWTLPEDYQTPSHQIFSQQQKNAILKLKDSHLQHNLYLQLFNMICGVLQRKDQYKKLLLPNSNQHVMICHNDLNNSTISTCLLTILKFSSQTMTTVLTTSSPMTLLTCSTSLSCFDYSTQNYPGFIFSKTFSAEQLEVVAIKVHVRGKFLLGNMESLKI